MRSLLLLASFISAGLTVDAAYARRTPADPAIMQLEYSKIAGMRTVVDHLAKSNLKCTDVSECVALPMGARACGGPSAFVVTSTLNPSLDAVTESVKLVTQAERDANKKFGMMSICSVKMPPPLDCVNNACVGAE